MIPTREQPYDDLVAELYRGSAFIRAEQFQEWALLQLRELIPFDSAMWGSGTLETLRFHSLTLINLPEDYPRTLEKTTEDNPIWKALIENIGTPIDSTKIIPDDRFFGSSIYKRAFGRFSISRLLATLHNEPRGGVLTLISLYRNDPKQRFTVDEKNLKQRAVRHLVNAASHAFFTHLTRTAPGAGVHAPAAVCDREGYLHEVQPQFLDLLQEHFPNWKGPKLPFAVPAPDSAFTYEDVCGHCSSLKDKLCLQIWQAGPLDALTERERQVVESVCRGLSFKEIARHEGIAPSTVSNHLYRIYRKLGVRNRTSLAKLMQPGSRPSNLWQQAASRLRKARIGYAGHPEETT